MSKFMFDNNTESEITCPHCPEQIKLIVKTNRRQQTQFLGCPNWPECGYTAPVPESWYMRAAGQKGFWEEL